MTEITQLVIAEPCRWCDGKGWVTGFWPPTKTCDHCLGTGDHNYRYNNNQVTYKEIVVGRIINE